MGVNRRSFLVAGTLAAGGFLVGCASASRQQLRGDPWTLKDGQVALNGWIKLAPDNTVTVVLAKSEMGQGVHTALMMLVAEELDADWPQLRTEYATIDKLYGNVAAMSEGLPFRPDDEGMLARSLRWAITQAMRQMGIMMTGGSSSIRDLWQPMREAAAVTRATLVDAVARHWQVQPAQVQVDNGRLIGPTGQSLPFGEALALLGQSPSPAAQYQLKTPEQFKVIGRPHARHDSAEKSTGKAVFGMDVQLPGMLYAALALAPVRGGRVREWNGRAASQKPGVEGVVAFEPLHGGTGGVAVVARRYWQAVQAVQALEVSFEDGPMAGADSKALTQTLRQALDTDEGFGFWRKGEALERIAGSQRVVRAEYSAPWLAHATMEPMNCTVQFDKDRATVWAPTQVPGLAREAAAKALGLEPEKVELRLTYLGGGFGRRLEVDFVAQAAAIARQFPGRTVQMIWNREQDMQHDFYRPAAVARYAAALDDQGRIQAWHGLSAGQAITPAYLSRAVGLPGGGPDKTTAEGAFDAAYEFPAVRVAHATVDLPVPVGFWRSVGHSHQAFFKECFLDECAHAAGSDPLAYRLQLLSQHPRQAAVLQLAADKAGWGRPLPAGPDGLSRARGLALHESFGAIVAQVVEVSVGPQREIRVHRVVCAMDCGLPVNPNTIAQQVESSVVYGLSAALAGEVRFEQGRAQLSNFHDQPPLRLAECPVIETHIVPSTAHPQGVGEPALPPLAPALANALFALTGQRLRSLPLRLNA
jgi:isoquinoline 1-oxidoreductase beta subunit